MDYNDGKDQRFSKQSLADAIHVWNRSAISLMDIRHHLITPQQGVRGYRLPASAFIYTGGGQAEVWLGELSYQTARFGLFHGGKGTELTILPQSDWMEYYLVLYKAEEPSTRKKDYARLLAHVNPYAQQYGFEPDNPIFLTELMRRMYEAWKGPTPLNLFYGKTAFYQLVYEVYQSLQQDRIPVLQPDIAAMAQRYIQQHYAQGLTVQEVAQAFGISASHFRSVFKLRTGISPQEYIMQCKMRAADTYLADGRFSLREIALALGFYDEFHFSSAYKKSTGQTPRGFQAIIRQSTGDSCMGNGDAFPYNEEGRVRYDELKGKGASYMFKQMGSRAAVAAALSLMLLMSACSAAPTGTAGVESTPTPVATAQETKVEAAQPEEKTTRTVSTVMGDIEVPINPQRVVVNWYIGDVLSAGLNVAGYSAWKHETMPFYEQMDATTQIDKWEPESVMKLEPDLIITYKAEDFEKFGKIAPVLVIEEKVPAPERAKMIGEATGHSEIANKNVEIFEAKLAAAKEVFKAEAFEGKTFSIMQDWGPSGDWSGVAYETGSRGGTLVYKYLGLTYPDKLAELIAENEDGRNTLSYEVAHEYFGDYILWFQQEDTESEYAKTEIWKSIPAVAEGRVLEIPGEYMGMFFFSDVLSLSAQLDYLIDGLNVLVK